MTVKREQWPQYVLFGVGAVFVVLKTWFLAPRFSDSAVYEYLGQRVMDGAIPYVDFFYSSPPLLLYVFGLVGFVSGWHWWSWSWIPIVLSVIDAGLLFWLAKRWCRSAERASPYWAGSIAAISYLFSYVVLATTDFATDVHFIVTLFLVALVLQVRGWNVLSGVVLAAAVLIKVYAVILIFPLIVWPLWRRHWRDSLFVVLGLGVTAGVVVAVLYFATGSAFYHAIITNNLGRGVGISREMLLPFIFWHDLWLLVAVLMPIASRRWAPLQLIMLIAAPLAFLLLYPDVYYLYFKLVAPFLALLLGWGSVYIIQDYGQWGRVVLAAIVVVVSLLSAVRYIREQGTAAVITDLSGVAAYVASATNPSDVLYGDFDVAPLVALESERRLYKDLADTNVKFFLNDVFKPEERLQELVTARVPILVTKAIVDGKSVLGGYEQTVTPGFIAQYCRVGKIFPIVRDYAHNAVVVWKCSY